MKDKKQNKRQSTWRYSFAFVILVTGLILNYFKLGQEFLGFTSVGNWLIYVGFVMFMVVTLQFSLAKKRIVDERSKFIGMKAAQITYVAIILVAFIIMVIDGIKPITLSYSYFMSDLICGIVLIYFIAYKTIEKYN